MRTTNKQHLRIRIRALRLAAVHGRRCAAICARHGRRKTSNTRVCNDDEISRTRISRARRGSGRSRNCRFCPCFGAADTSRGSARSTALVPLRSGRHPLRTTRPARRSSSQRRRQRRSQRFAASRPMNGKGRSAALRQVCRVTPSLRVTPSFALGPSALRAEMQQTMRIAGRKGHDARAGPALLPTAAKPRLGR